MVNKLEYLVRSVADSHYKCEYRQDGEPRSAIKCGGCSHSTESYERAIRRVVEFVNSEKEKAVNDKQFWLMTELRTEMMPLMIHTAQVGFPEMTAEILKSIYSWSGVKFNEAYAILKKK